MIVDGPFGVVFAGEFIGILAFSVFIIRIAFVFIIEDNNSNVVYAIQSFVGEKVNLRLIYCDSLKHIAWLFSINYRRNYHL